MPNCMHDYYGICMEENHITCSSPESCKDYKNAIDPEYTDKNLLLEISQATN